MKDVETIISELSKRIDIILEYRGTKIMDQQTVLLLRLIDKYGSILKASLSIGLPYSKAWDMITRIEKTLGIKIVERRRGGARRGGTRLTDQGIKLLEYYEKIRHETINKYKHYTTIGSLQEHREPDLIVMGSHDILLERLLYVMRKENNIDIHSSWIGSCGGILAIITGEADIAGIHLLDPTTKKYNYDILERYGLHGSAILVRGYDRELVIAYNPYYSYNSIYEIMNDIVDGRIKMVNRNRGSGTRVLFETLLREYSQNREIRYDIIKGYSIEVNTHQEVAEYIASGRVDVGITLRHLAETYGLKYIEITKERYDFIINIDSANKPVVKTFINTLKNKTRKISIGLKGYHIPHDIGEKMN